MTLHALTIAKRQSRADWMMIVQLGCLVMLATGCGGGGQPSPEGSVPAPNASAASTDAAWVESACQPASIDTTGWSQYRIGDLTIRIPNEYVRVGFLPYQLSVRGPGGELFVQVHRNARYIFDGLNKARRGQNWCNGTLGGYQAEIMSWFEPFSFRPTNTRAGELRTSAPYNFAARLKATWVTQDNEWFFAFVSATRIRDAQRLRDALHTLEVVKTPER